MGLRSDVGARLVGGRCSLVMTVCRDGDRADGGIVCDVSVEGLLPGGGGVSSVGLGRVRGASCEDVSDAVIAIVAASGRKVKNATMLRYDLESAVRDVDRRIAKARGGDAGAAGDDIQPPSHRDATIETSLGQVEQMIDELPVTSTSHVERMMLDAFKEAVRNVIAAAYDAGVRDGAAATGMGGEAIA